MGTAAQPFLNPIAAAEGEATGSRLSTEKLARRAKQRRQVQGMIGVSYVVDAGILLTYAYAGTIKVWVGPAYAVCGLLLMAVTILLSEIGFNERLDGLQAATRRPANALCRACLTREYPTPVPLDSAKLRFEAAL